MESKGMNRRQGCVPCDITERFLDSLGVNSTAHDKELKSTSFRDKSCKCTIDLIKASIVDIDKSVRGIHPDNRCIIVNLMTSQIGSTSVQVCDIVCTVWVKVSIPESVRTSPFISCGQSEGVLTAWQTKHML
eukprot:CAMPEP_0116871202 /NCGR_PEP_ID=MMETSP0463-20121206/1446_1 /TAXON_ID=181622 /ORGANISM="Strombidinopsis sp, Strain SopsisLIS2011" /LENGTH=131 /DNA_ID=CAMNT_0004509175 /DNA_START=1729 /DNA_END=2124 /DNA_ORIENTATION=+